MKEINYLSTIMMNINGLPQLHNITKQNKNIKVDQ